MPTSSSVTGPSEFLRRSWIRMVRWGQLGSDAKWGPEQRAHFLGMCIQVEPLMLQLVHSWCLALCGPEQRRQTAGALHLCQACPNLKQFLHWSLGPAV